MTNRNEFNIFIGKLHSQMFNIFSNQTQSPDPEPLFATEKELILSVIRCGTNSSRIYKEHALPEWKAQYPLEQGYVYSFNVWDTDYSLIWKVAQTSDDEEILRAIYDIHRTGFMLSDMGRITYPKLYLNANLPDGMIEFYINSPLFPNENLSMQMDRLEEMLEVGFNSTVNEKIQSRIDEIVVIKRKKKEDKMKDKLKAFLITAAATKSVLTGNSIDDVVDASINDTVDDDVLEYMTKLFGNKK